MSEEQLRHYIIRYGIGVFNVWKAVLMMCLVLTVTQTASAKEIISNLSLPPGITANCLDCHDDYTYREEFSGSVHGNNGCRSCHTGVKNIARHMRGEETIDKVACGVCHENAAVQHEKSIHYIKGKLQCGNCHRGIHSLRAEDKDYKRAVVEGCSQCHDPEKYVALGHSNALLKGNRDAAACSDCHGIHDVPVYGGEDPKATVVFREAYTKKCLACHENRDMMRRNGVSLEAATNYGQTYHGKVRRLDYTYRVAGCADCHTGHNILPQTDPHSAVFRENLDKSCMQCHTKHHRRFAAFIAHPDPENRVQFPVLYWTNIFMICLLVSVFVFFWLHTVLWWRRVYWDLCKRRKAGTAIATLSVTCDESQYVERFSVKERIMHVLLILSFFTLVLTGFPLKYHDAAWAGVMINLWGGAKQAGMFHRAAALILSALFLYTVWLSLKFLFPKGVGVKGWIGRLLGPDSLCPNLKDLQDVIGMFKWFFNRGEMPKFERWTYWEKFDFFAVFWGMFAIGLSGLILWFPELFSYMMPGWMINVATVVHSEEAFLAAIFIFTVHFFNNHFVPNKFPLEPNIFTGRYTVEAMQHERPMEYERMVDQERLDGLKRKGPGLFIQFFASMIGLGSLLLGLLLTVLIFWAALYY